MRVRSAVFGVENIMAFKQCAFKAELAFGTLLALAASSLALADTSGPVRMARISYMTGRVSWRPDGTTGWSRAALNLPLRQGAEVWLAQNSRLELQFDDGSTLRLGDGAVATLQTLYSDNQGEFTEVKLSAGTSSWHLKDKYSIYQIDAPCDSVKAVGPSDFRMDIKPRADALAVRRGSATISAGGRDTPILAGHYTVLHSPSDPVQVRSLGSEDPWDRFNDNRNAILAEEPEHVPTDIAIVSGGLDRHGRWYDVPGDGWVWSPTVEAGWRPYHRGHWAWVDPYGWTWVSADPWGWAPYHYGTWAHFGFGWGWAPGPAVQYWSPACVDFAESNGYVTWVPLAPEEVVYPAFSIGFGGGNWWANFSIGGAGVYQPYGVGAWQPVAYPYAYNNPGWRRHGWEQGGWGQGNFAANRTNFVPRNAVFGAVGVSARGFNGNVQYAAINRNASGSFRARTQVVANRQAFSGPVTVHPNRTSFTPGHTFTTNARPAVLNRALVRGRVSPTIARTSGSFGPARSFASRPNGVATRTRAFAPNVGRQPANVAAARSSMAFRGRSGVVFAGRANNGRAVARATSPRSVGSRNPALSGSARAFAARGRGVQNANRPNFRMPTAANRGRPQPTTVRSHIVQSTTRSTTRRTFTSNRARTPVATPSRGFRSTNPPIAGRSTPANRGRSPISNRTQRTVRPAPTRNFGGNRSASPTRSFGGSRYAAPTRNFGGNRGAPPTRSFGGSRSAAPTRSFGGNRSAPPTRSFGGSRNAAPTRNFGGNRAVPPTRNFGGSRGPAPTRNPGGNRGAGPTRSFAPQRGAAPRGNPRVSRGSSGPSNRGGPSNKNRGGG